ncbi:MAG: NADPH-dependent FMN reductase [Thermomonas sp.]
MNDVKIAVVVGSVGADAINRRLASAVEKLAHDACRLRHVRIEDLPLHNPDFVADQPQNCRRLKQAADACGALLFVTPTPHGSTSLRGSCSSTTIRLRRMARSPATARANVCKTS